MKLLLLNREEELISIISETTSDPIYDEVLNGEDTFEFEVSEYSIEKGYRVLFQDINSDWREYVVVGIEEKHNRNGLRKKVYCESSFYELLGDWLADIRPNNRTARYALEQALSTSRWEVGIVDDLGLNSTNYYRTDAKTAVEKVAEVWGGEIKTRIEVIGNKITGRFIDLYRNRGTDSGKRFTYTKDIEEVTRDVSEDLIITALHGFGKSEEIGDGFGRRIDFSSINDGKSYLENNSARLMYGRNNSDGTKSHVFGKVEFDDIEDIELLKTEAQKALDALSIPSVLYKVQVQDLSVFGYEHEKVNLGDYVLIADKEFIPELRFKARVVEIKRNLANELETEITIGNVLESYTSKMNSQSNALNDIRDRIGVLDKIADGSYSLPRTDGQGYNYYGSAAPSNPHNGDVWFKPNGEFQEVWQYVDGQWTLLLDTSVPDQLKKEVEAAQAKAEAAQQAAEQAYTDAVTEAERLVAEQSEAFDTKFETETGVIRNEIEQGYTDAVAESERLVGVQAESFDTQMSDVNQEINTVKTNIDTSIFNINQDITDNFTSLSDSISDVASVADQAKADAQTGITNAATALSQANSAIGSAQAAQQNALTALGKADNALGGVSNLDVRVDDVEAEVALKADNTFISEDGVLTTLSNAITVNANRFSSDMQRIESRVESLAGEINLVILKDAFENKWLLGNEVYPNATTSVGADTMRETIAVVPGEQIALSKNAVVGDNAWRINCYTKNMGFIIRLSPSEHKVVITVPSDTYYLWVSYPQKSKPQMVRGTTFVPYRPSLADQMTTDEMVLFRNEYDEFADKTVRRLTAIDSSGGRLETAELLIDQVAGGLALKADTTTVNTLTGRLSTAEGQISAQSGQIALRVTEVQAKNIANSAVDGIKVGGSNLLNKSGQLNLHLEKRPTTQVSMVSGVTVDGHTDGWNVTVNGGGLTLRALFRFILKAGTPYSMSVTVKNHRNFDLLIDTYPASKIVIVKSGETKRVKFEGVLPDSSGQLQMRFLVSETDINAGYLLFDLWGLMVESGTKSGDWKPATEDTMELISAVSSELKIEKDNITALLTRTSNNETVINQVKSTADGTKQTVVNHDGRLTTVETNVSGLQVSVADKISNAQFTVLSNSVNSVVSNLSNTDIKARMASGRHLATDTVFEKGYNGIVKYANTNQQNVSITRRTTVGYSVPTDSPWMLWIEVTGETNPVFGGIHRPINGRANAEFVVKFTALLPVGRVFNNMSTGLGNGGSITWLTSNVGTGTWTEYMYHVKHGSGAVGGFGYLYVSGGATPTPSSPLTWLLAKYETVDISSSNQSQITQLSDQINLRVEKGDVVSQINVEAGRTLISSGKILLDGDTYVMGTTFVNDIKAKSLEAVNANIGDLRTKILTADVIEATHLKVDNALIDKLTVNTAVVDRFFAKTAVIDNLSVKTLDAITANITSIRSKVLVADAVTSTHLKSDTALIDKLFASTANIDQLTSKTAFINNIKAIDISADKITTGTLNAANVNIINLNANNITTGTLDASKVTVKNLSADSITSGSLRADLISSSFGSQYSIFMGAGYLSISGSLGNKVELNTNSLTFSNPNSDGFEIWSYNDTVRLNVAMNKNFYLYRGSATTSGASAIISVLGADAEINFWRNLNMRSKSITNQSDQTLKTNITATVVKALDLFKSYNFVDFNWIDPMSPQERQFGLIAQRTPFLSEQGEDGIWNINSSKQIMLNSLGIKELDEKVTRIDTFISQHDIEIDNLKKENEKLRQRIQSLEEKVA